MQTTVKKKKEKRRFVFWILIALCVLLFIGVLIAGLAIKMNFRTTLPEDFFSMNIIGQSPRFFVYRFTDRQNRIGTAEQLLETGFEQKADNYVSYGEIPQSVIDSFIAIEDKRFYHHKGVDWYRTAAACVNYLFKGQTHFGASTITQQLIKNMTGNDTVSISRKLQEILYALDLERTLDKTQIMEMYLNIIHFSDNCNGIVQAANHYFGKHPSELTVAEAATIAAITNNPSYYNPIRHPENNLKRRNLILSEMKEQGMITPDEYEEAVNRPLLLSVVESDPKSCVSSWYIDMVVEDVINDLMREHGLSRSSASSLVFRGGLRIDLAMDEKVQKIVEDYYENAVVTPVNQKGERAQSALIMIDSHTGDILGVAGAIGSKQGNRIQNFATQTKRPPGSVIKPLSVYAPALEEGIINWASVYDDVPVDFGKSGTKAWPKNANGIYRGLTNIPYAVAHSTNTVAVRVLQDIGLEKAYSYAKNRFHLSDLVKQDQNTAALALGQLNYGVTLRDLTSAYTAFADAGTYHPWRSYYRVIASDGRILLSNDEKSEIALSEGNAAIMTKLLQGVVENGTSASITLKNTVECAGKTGTTNADGDRWFVGYTPDIVCGVWCGYEYPEPLVGKNLCTDIWNRMMISVFDARGGNTRFRIPSTLVRASYCKDSGMLMGETCSLDVRGDREEVGWFLREQLPRERCNRHVMCEYDSENHGISHGFCPLCQKVALIDVSRKFPVPITVSDAPYTYCKDPETILPNPNANQAYYEADWGAFCGISSNLSPFNASCREHTNVASLPNDRSHWFPWIYPKNTE